MNQKIEMEEMDVDSIDIVDGKIVIFNTCGLFFTTHNIILMEDK